MSLSCHAEDPTNKNDIKTTSDVSQTPSFGSQCVQNVFYTDTEPSQQQCFHKSCNTRFRDTRFAILGVTHGLVRVLHTFFITHVFKTCVKHEMRKHMLRKRVLPENMYIENVCYRYENVCDENMCIRKHMLQ